MLILPLVAIRLSDAVDWDLADFVVAAVLLGGAGLALEASLLASGSRAFRAGAAVALATAVLLVWANAAVGIVGSEGDPINRLYSGVLAVAVVGAALARFRPQGLARALAATAFAQALVAAGALASTPPPDRRIEILAVNGLFVALWLASAALFRKAAEANPR